jgi:hypothetical protein
VKQVRATAGASTVYRLHGWGDLAGAALPGKAREGLAGSAVPDSRPVPARSLVADAFKVGRVVDGHGGLARIRHSSLIAVSDPSPLRKSADRSIAGTAPVSPATQRQDYGA